MLTLMEAADRLQQMNQILLLCHAEPDGDTVGSSVALALGLRQMGKQAAICCADPIPDKYDYMHTDELIADFVPMSIVSVDVADRVLLGKLAEKYPAIDLAVDHHQSHRSFAANAYVDYSACACAMVVYDLLTSLHVTINQRIADALYTGIATDSGCFLYSSTSPKTHRITAKLMEAGADFAVINRAMFETKSFARLRLEQACLDGLTLHFDGKCALSVLPDDIMETTGAAPSDMDGIAAIPRCVQGVEIGILLRTKEPGVLKASVRTNTKADASALCAVFGGGGHLHAAGCTLKQPANQAVEALLKAADFELRRCGCMQGQEESDAACPDSVCG